eukprot:11079_1
MDDEFDDSINRSVTKSSDSKQLSHVHRLHNPYPENEILYHDKMNIIFEMDPHNICVPAAYAERYVNLIYNKYMFALICILAIGDFIGDTIVDNTEGNEHRIWFIIVMVTHDILCDIILIALLLSLNRNAWKNIIKTFEFWFKFAYVLFQEAISTSQLADASAMKYSRILHTILVIVILALADGFPLGDIKFGPWIPGVASFIVAVNYAYYSVWYMFFPIPPGTFPNETINISDDMSFSITNVLASIWRMQALFLFKQSVNLAFRPGHSTMFGFNPLLRWENTEKQEEEDNLDLAMEMASKKKSENPVVTQIDQEKVKRADRDDRTKNDSKDSILDEFEVPQGDQSLSLSE